MSWKQGTGGVHLSFPGKLYVSSNQNLIAGLLQAPLFLREKGKSVIYGLLQPKYEIYRMRKIRHDSNKFSTLGELNEVTVVP